MYLKGLIEELNITEEIDKAVLAAIVVTTINSNNLCDGVDQDDLINSVIDGVTSRYMFDICNLAACWCNDLTVLFCKKINYQDEWYKFFPNVVWKLLREKSPMEGVKLMK